MSGEIGLSQPSGCSCSAACSGPGADRQRLPPDAHTLMSGVRNAISAFTLLGRPTLDQPGRQPALRAVGASGARLRPVSTWSAASLSRPDLAMFRRKESSDGANLTIELGAVLLLALGLKGLAKIRHPPHGPTVWAAPGPALRWSLCWPSRGGGLALDAGRPGGRRRPRSLLAFRVAILHARNRSPVQRLRRRLLLAGRPRRHAAAGGLNLLGQVSVLVSVLVGAIHLQRFSWWRCGKLRNDPHTRAGRFVPSAMPSIS